MDMTGIIVAAATVVAVGILGTVLLSVLGTICIVGAVASLAVKGSRAIHSGSVTVPLFSLGRPAKPQRSPLEESPAPRARRRQSVNSAPQTMIGRVLAAEAAEAEAAVDADETPASPDWSQPDNSFFDPADLDRDGVIDI